MMLPHTLTAARSYAWTQLRLSSLFVFLLGGECRGCLGLLEEGRPGLEDVAILCLGKDFLRILTMSVDPSIDEGLGDVTDVSRRVVGIQECELCWEDGVLQHWL